jgi:poly(U)-specific endoribonuclease
MNFVKVEQFYRDIYSNKTAVSIRDFFTTLNPPPDTLIKIRATAFKIACQYLSSDNNDDDKNALIDTIRTIVETIDECCYTLKDLNDATTATSSLDEDACVTFYRSLFDGATLDTEENEQLLSFLKEAIPVSSIRQARSLVFSTGAQCFVDNNDTNATTQNEQVLRCMNVIVHAIEATFYQPKPYHIQLTTSMNSRPHGGTAGSAGGETAPSPAINTNVDLHQMKLNDAVQQLWNYDANRLTFNDDLIINVQNGKKPYMKEDAATDPLFTSVKREALQRSTFASFIHLLDNYTSATGTVEQITAVEQTEIKAFLSTIMETAPMQFCYQYCKAHNVLSRDTDSTTEFIHLLQSIWFDQYSRDGKKDSSGFEHVFIGEIQDNAISGFHNWIQFYLQEQKGNIDYRGYVKPRGHNQMGHDSDDHLLTLQFAWKSPSGVYVEKFVGTMFVGVSPEFEMALYTMCFLFGEEENYITLDTGVDIFELVIKCYKMAQGKIGTTFPEVNSHYGDNDD